MNKKLRSRLTQLYLELAIPLLLAVILVNLLGFRMLKAQQTQIRATGLERYVQQLGAEMQSIQNHLVTFCTTETDINNMQYLNNESERILASKRLIDRMKNDVIIYNNVQVEFLYSHYLKKTMIVREGSASFRQMQQQNAIVQALTECVDTDPLAVLTGTWQVCQEDGDYYLLYCYSSGDAYVGVLLDVQAILTIPESLHISSEVSLVQNGQVIIPVESDWQEDTHREAILAPIGNTGLALQMCLEDGQAGVQRAWPLLFVMLLMCVIITLVALYYFTSTKMVNPIHRIVSAMRRVGDGELSVRIDTGGMLEELASIGETMNHTLDQIESLQKKEQEAIRQEQMSRLRNLQLQINPHFLGNCFNMLNNASLCGDVDMVFSMTKHLSGYFRSMGQMEQDFISVAEELRFVEDYLEIQKIRFPDQFAYRIYAPVFLNQVQIPPSVIKSFAENTVQYCRSLGFQVMLEIELSLQENAPCPRLEIIVQDNGPGFREDVLALLQGDEDLYFDGRVHIGITNVKKRLNILYGERSSITIDNRPEGGARIAIGIPLNQKGENGVCSMS